MEVKSQATVDAVIPTYERPADRQAQNQMLRDALSSVLAQTYPVSNIFVIADGKSQTARSIVGQFHNEHIYFIESGEKNGGGSARNIGIRSSQADYVAFLDDDDIWGPNKIERQLSALANYSSEDLVFSFTQVQSEEVGRFDLLPLQGPKTEWSLAEYIFLHNGYITTSTIMASRALLAKNMFTEKLPKHQDWDWLFKADFFCKAKSVFVKMPLTTYRTQYPGRSMSVSQRNTWQFSHNWILKFKSYLNPAIIASFDRGHVVDGLLNDHSMSKLVKLIKLFQIMQDFSWADQREEWRIKIKPFIKSQLRGSKHA
ncbi:glycosyltransferase family 2 protein [Oenococcus sp.]|uniref:glycosyltransferase family 2 protein n=1 Tax=Oenococcus sp. TaxID=1979414 RepID=UPI0039EBF24B